jgi:cellulose biosynthesis protein BcsQ
MGKSDLRPVMAVYSLAGGVGKTTLCANLGQALSWAGEKVLLVDATGSGLLPFYFGADDLVSGSRTTIAARNDRVSLRVISAEEITEEWLEREVKPAMESSSWTIFDLGPAPMSLLPQILAMTSFLIVPLLPDLNSILTVSRVESSLEIMRSRGAEIPTPFYLFNQFDPEDPIDQGARDLVLRQCGGRLLPLSIPYDTEAAKAIASRMTVIEHDPGAEIASVSLKLATMLRKAVPGHYTRRPARRWNEV